MSGPDLPTEIEGLRKLALSQAAQIAMLVGLLYRAGVLSREESMVVALAGEDAMKFPSLEPEQVRAWITNQIRQVGQPTAPGQRAPNPREG